MINIKNAPQTIRRAEKEENIGLCGECGKSFNLNDNDYYYCSQCGLSLFALDDENEDYEVTSDMKSTPPNKCDRFDPIDTILSVKREIRETASFICSAFGQREGAESTWGLEQAIVSLNQLHQWVSTKEGAVEFNN